MMRSLLFVAWLVLGGVTSGFAQYDEGSPMTYNPNVAFDQTFSRKIFSRVNILGTGAGFEFGLSKSFSISAEGGITFVPVLGTDPANNTQSVYFFIYGYGKLNPRFYYNVGKRQRAGATVSKYSANYVGLYSMVRVPTNKSKARATLFLDLPPEYYQTAVIFGPVWGMQRTFGKSELFYFNFAVGPGIYVLPERKLLNSPIDSRFVDFTPLMELGIGLAL